ncbi:MAG: hypothetical protein ACM31D_07840 [Bacteroidota bacterium]
MLRIEEIVGAMDDEFRYALDALSDERLAQLAADKPALRRMRPVGVSTAEALEMIATIQARRAEQRRKDEAAEKRKAARKEKRKATPRRKKPAPPPVEAPAQLAAPPTQAVDNPASFIVIPAKAGIHGSAAPCQDGTVSIRPNMDPRFRGGDDQTRWASICRKSVPVPPVVLELPAPPVSAQLPPPAATGPAIRLPPPQVEAPAIVLPPPPQAAAPAPVPAPLPAPPPPVAVRPRRRLLGVAIALAALAAALLLAR